MPDLDLSLNFEAVNAEISIPGIAGPRGPEGIVRTGELDSRYYSVNNPSGFITGVDLSRVVYNTGNQTISGIKTFGTGIIAPNLVYNTGNQIINGDKTFLSKILFGNENGTVGYISGNQYFDSDSALFITTEGNGANYIYLTAGPASMNLGEGGFNINAGNESINIDNSDGIFINGPYAEIYAPTASATLKSVDINTLLNITSISGGRQVGYISGESLDDGDVSNLHIKTNGGGEQRVILQAEGHTLTLGRDGGLSYGNNQFVIDGNSENLRIQNADVYVQQNAYANNLVYNTGNQIISGIKTFAEGVDLNNIDNLNLSGVDVTITSGIVALTNRPTVNGTGVLLSGEAAVLPATIVYTTGDQSISGVKTFATRPTVNNTGILISGEAVTSNGSINSIIRLTQATYNALSPKDSNTFYVIVG